MLFGRRERRITSILIVEDEPLVAFDNEYFLNDAGYKVIATVDGAAAAIRQMDRSRPDLVLTDVALSEGSGLDVARHAGEGDIPVMFVTGGCPPDARSLAVGCLAKPYTQRDLLAAIEAVDAVIGGKPPKKVPRAFTLFAR